MIYFCLFLYTIVEKQYKNYIFVDEKRHVIYNDVE